MTEVLPTVLLVEDDDAIQGIVEEALREGGFEFTSAKTGEEAVTLLKGRLVAYCALVTDINLLGSLT
ncbi:response regulator, partial [Bradyrhizobium sp. RT3a]